MKHRLETALKRMEQNMIQTLISQQIKPVKPTFTQNKIPFESTKEFQEMDSFFRSDTMIQSFRRLCPSQKTRKITKKIRVE